MSFLDTIKSWFGLASTPTRMRPGDRLLQCADCGQPFVFDAGEQTFFRERGFTDPKRCPNCRKSARSRLRRRGRGRGGQPQNNQNAATPPSHPSQQRRNEGHRGNEQRPFSGNSGGGHAPQGGGSSRRHRHRRRHHGVIDGDSPYADER